MSNGQFDPQRAAELHRDASLGLGVAPEISRDQMLAARRVVRTRNRVRQGPPAGDRDWFQRKHVLGMDHTSGMGQGVSSGWIVLVSHA